MLGSIRNHPGERFLDGESFAAVIGARLASIRSRRCNLIDGPQCIERARISNERQ
jgi:hypothetical protein